MNATQQTLNFQLGLLHFLHLLAMVDGVIDERERKAIRAIVKEEEIPEVVFLDFETAIARKAEKEIYQEGLVLLNRCDDDEKKCVFVHLYRLSEADDKIHVKEVRLLLYSLRATNIDFEDVEIIARLTKAKAEMVYQSNRRSVA